MRKSGRAIIFVDGKILLMHRINKDKDYYTFAGGGVDDGESFSECTKREVLEEFGINVDIVKRIFRYKSNHTEQEFYLANYVSGEFGSGQGEEFDGNSKYGKFIPEKVDIEKISSINLKPTVIKYLLVQNIINNNTNLKEFESVIEDYDTEY